jgi:hypothetical protein
MMSTFSMPVMLSIVPRYLEARAFFQLRRVPAGRQPDSVRANIRRPRTWYDTKFTPPRGPEHSISKSHDANFPCSSSRSVSSGVEGLILARFTITNNYSSSRCRSASTCVIQMWLKQAFPRKVYRTRLRDRVYTKACTRNNMTIIIHHSYSYDPKCRLRKQVVKKARANPQSLQDRKQPAERHSLPRCYREQVA